MHGGDRHGAAYHRRYDHREGHGFTFLVDEGEFLKERAQQPEGLQGLLARWTLGDHRHRQIADENEPGRFVIAWPTEQTTIAAQCGALDDAVERSERPFTDHAQDLRGDVSWRVDANILLPLHIEALPGSIAAESAPHHSQVDRDDARHHHDFAASILGPDEGDSLDLPIALVERHFGSDESGNTLVGSNMSLATFDGYDRGGLWGGFV